MNNYTASPLDSNKTLLQAFHDIETYLKNNPIYKVYTANIGYTQGTNTYMLSNINVGENTIAENDVIFFNNAYVGIVSAVGSTEVTVKNVTDLRGPAGAAGSQGPAGATGPQGPTGATGPQGPTGATGPQGPAGADGRGFNFIGVWIDDNEYHKDDVVTRTLESGMNSSYICVENINGSNIPPEQDTTHWTLFVSGVQGEQGVQGIQGAAGPQGPQGIQGVPGPQGEQGEIGPQGPAGATGARGATGPQGPQGPQGPAGADGADGASFRIVGSVDAISDLPPTADAGTAYFVGATPPRLVYVYDIETNTWKNQGYLQGPQGATGPQGPQGIQGLRGESGPQGETGPQGPQGIQGPIGESGPQGETGPQGPTGATGENALYYNNIVSMERVPVAGDTFNVTTSLCSRTPVKGDVFLCIFKYQTRSWLTSCKIANKVNDTNYTASISFLQESTGEQGAQGPQGPQGPAGSTTISYRHSIRILSVFGSPYLTLYNNSPDPIDNLEKLIQALGNSGTLVPLTGMYLNFPNEIKIFQTIQGFSTGSTVQIRALSIELTGNVPAQIRSVKNLITSHESGTIADIVTEL